MSQPVENRSDRVGACNSVGSVPLTRAALRKSRHHGRAGRNLPAAIGVGVGLGTVAVAGLFIRKEIFLAVLAVTIGLALWELTQALGQRAVTVPLVPVMIGAVAMLVAAYSAGGQALTVCFILTVIAVVVWRMSEGPDGALQDVSSGVFIVAYLPLLAGFVPLMLAQDDGSWRVFTFLVVTVCSDVGGYATGVLTGRHPMAPTVSPHKSWEGFMGSALACVIGGTVCVLWALGGPWWGGVVLGFAVVAAATLGDLAESLMKRDLGMKDMGSVLPGHGGVLDRVDSMLMAAPVAWLVLHLMV